MNRIIALIFINLVTLSAAFSQGQKAKPVFKEVSGFQVVKSIFPTAAELVQANEVWFKIVDDKKAVLGYCISSKPYSSGIIGYNGETPVIVVFDKNCVVKKVSILSNSETAGYLAKLERQNFFKNWYGLTIKDAMNVKASADSYSGATISANALRQNVDLILRKAYSKRL